MRKNLTIIFLLLFAKAAFCQSTDTAVTFFFFVVLGFTHKVRTIDSADFFRVILAPDSGDVLYNVKEFYVNGKPKLIGKSDQYLTRPTTGFIVLQGTCLTYFPDGKRQSISNYYDGYLDGQCTLYYPNGKLYCQLKYGYRSATSYIDCYDKNGNITAHDGTGHWLSYIFTFPDYIAEGNIKNGTPDGVWRGEVTLPEQISPDHIKFTYNFSKGKFTDGKGYDTEGKAYAFTHVQEPAKFKDGPLAFSGYIQRNLVLPRDSAGNKIRDEVWVTFVVEKDGHLDDFKVLDNPNAALAAATLEVLKKCPNWIPRKFFGVPLATRITFPINENTYIGNTRNGRPWHLLNYGEAIPNIGIFGQ